MAICRGVRGELDTFSSVASTDAIYKRKIMKHVGNKDLVLATYHCNFKIPDLNVSPGLTNRKNHNEQGELAYLPG